MKYIVTVIALMISMFSVSAMASASTATIDGTVVSSTAIMQQVIRNNPERSCSIVEVPVYGNTKGNASDAIAGAIIGGILGNQVGGGKGKDAATILGAIVGADVANKNSNKPGSVQRQCQIETRYEERQREIYSHSTVTFSTEGKKYTVKFQKN